MNASPLIYRVLFLVLLPCISAILYFSGQNYDPALIDFKTASEKMEEVLASAAPSPDRPLSSPEAKPIPGFRQVGREQRYTKDNLYEHVNGHAEYFISAGFLGLTVAEYIAVDSKSEQSELQAEVFDMGKSIQAFGVLVDESGDNAKAVSVGAMGFRTSGSINFIRGRYYVKISALNPKAETLKLARGLSDRLSDNRDSFDIFSRLPDLGKIEKTRFIKEGYRGLDFLHNIIEREYSVGDSKITVALMAVSRQQKKDLQIAFFDYFRTSGMRYEKVDKYGREFYKVMDKYEGNWFLILSPDTLFGVFGTEDETIVNYFGKSNG